MVIPALRDASEDLALRGAPLAVYVFVLHHLERHAFRPVKADAVGATLQMRRHTVGRALSLLVVRGYLAEGPRDGKMRTYRLLETRLRPDGPLTVQRHTA